MPGGFDAIEFASFPRGGNCRAFSQSIQEPYTSLYWPRGDLVLDYPWTVIKRSFWDWDGAITRKQFDQERLKRPRNDSGGYCDEVIHYKIVKSRLYWMTGCDPCGPRRAVMEEMLMVSSAW